MSLLSGTVRFVLIVAIVVLTLVILTIMMVMACGRGARNYIHAVAR